MNKKYMKLFWIGFCICQVLYIIAIILISAYYIDDNKIQFTTKIKIGHIVEQSTHINSHSVNQAIMIRDKIYIISVFISILIIWLTKSQPKSYIRFIFFILQPVLFYRELVGIIMFIYSFFLGIDGEWLAEHWPTYIAISFWNLFSILISILSYDKAWIKKLKSNSNIATQLY